MATEKMFPSPVPRDVLHVCAHMPGWPTNATTRHMAERLAYLEPIHDSLVADHRRLRELAEKVNAAANEPGSKFGVEWWNKVSGALIELRTFLEQSSSGSKG